MIALKSNRKNWKPIELLEDFIFSVIETESLPSIRGTSFWTLLLSDAL